MALDASQILGSPQLAGVKVNPKGMARRVAGPITGGVVGPVAGALSTRIALGKSDGPASSETPHFGRLAFLAVTDNELALIKLKSGVVRVHLDETVVRVPRGEVASAELGKGLAPPLTIEFTNGDSWQLEIPTPSKKDAAAVVHTLDG